MGVIIRQSFKSSVVSFTGAVLGFLSVIYVYPLELEAVGFVNNLYAIGTLFGPFVAVGLSSVAIKFFPDFFDKKTSRTKGLIPFLFFNVLLNTALFTIFFIVFKDVIYTAMMRLGFDVSMVEAHELIILLLVVTLSLINIITGLISNYGRIVFPNIFINLGFKIFLPVIILLIFRNLIDVSLLPYLILFFFIGVFFANGIYLTVIKKLEFNVKGLFKKRYDYKEIYSFSFLSGLTYIGSILAYRIDVIMISGFIGLKEAGMYILPMTMAAIMDIPNSAILNVSTPIVSKAWKDGDLNKIKSIYKKASLNLFLIGGIILIGGYFCFESLGMISSKPEVFISLKNIFLLLALTKLVDMITSINSAIIGYSKNFKANLYFVMILAVLNISLNYYFINQYGLIGVSMATLISISLFNAFKLIFIYRKFGFHPFTKSLFQGAAIFVFVGLVGYLLPDLNNSYLNIVYKASILSISYFVLLYFLKISVDLNKIVNNRIIKKRF